MSTNNAWLAERTVTAIRPSGERLDVTLRIGLPYAIAAEEWACPMEVEGLHGLRPVRGIDAWQALQLALSLQAQVLGYFIEGGGRLLWHETSYAIELGELFPTVRTLPT